MRPLALILAAAAVLSCASKQKTDTTPEPRPAAPPLTPTATRVFNYLSTAEEGSAVVMNLDQLQKLGINGPMDVLRSLPQSLLAMMPLSGSIPADASSPTPDLTRYAVIVAALDAWADLPSFRRMGVWIPKAGGAMQGLPAGVLVFATDKPSVPNEELFQGLAAMSRVLAESGKGPVLQVRNRSLCVGDASLGVPLCLAADEGLLMLSIEGSAQRLFTAVSSSKPGPPAPPNAALWGHLEVDPSTKVLLSAVGDDAVALHAELQTNNPYLLEGASSKVTGLLANWDRQTEARRRNFESGVEMLNAQLAADPSAPPSLKKAAAGLTAQSLQDPWGYSDAFRRSVKTARSEHAFVLDAMMPAGATRALADLLSPSKPVFMLGVLAAIAIPNFLKFQCRSKQAEAKSSLRSLFTENQLYQADNGRDAQSLEELSFDPGPGARYTYCMASGCISCTGKECTGTKTVQGPCEALVPQVPAANKKQKKKPAAPFFACAYSNFDSDETIDVWTVGPDGQPENQTNDCQ